MSHATSRGNANVKVSVVTPSYNHGKYIEETIESVLSQQGDFFLEYIIMDGGSKDSTVETIKKYERLLKEKKYPVRCQGIDYRWRSEPDEGQGDAVSRGFGMAQGEILGWLNSDDVYNEGALMKAVECFGKSRDIGYSYGDIYTMNEDGSDRKYARYPAPYDWKRFVQGKQRGLVQPGVFVRREVFQKAGPVDSHWYFALDQDWFIRVDQKFKGRYVPFPFATERIHSQAKTYDRFVLGYMAEMILLLTKFGGGKAFLKYFGYAVAEFAVEKGLTPEESFKILHEAILKRGELTDLSLLTPRLLSDSLGYGLLRFSLETSAQDIRKAFGYLIRAIQLYPYSIIKEEAYLILLKMVTSKSLYLKMLEKVKTRLQYLLLVVASRALSFLFLPWRMFRKTAFKRSARPIHEVWIVYMAEGLGDVIMLSGALPAIRSRFHDAKITLMIFERYREYFRGNPYVDELMGYPDFLFKKNGIIPFLSFVREAGKKCRPDVLLDLLPNKNFQSAIFSCFFPCRFSVGFGYLWKDACYDEVVEVDWGKHFYEVLFDALKWAGITAQAPEYWIPPLEAEGELLREVSLSPKTIVLAPGGKNNLIEGGNESHWDFGNYQELVKTLTEKGYRIILVGAEYDRHEFWNRFDSSQVLNLIGETSIRQLFDLVKKKADLVVCNNSGLLHVAAALGVPTVSFAGPLENIVRFGPYPNDGRHKVLQDTFAKKVSLNDFMIRIDHALTKTISAQ